MVLGQFHNAAADYTVSDECVKRPYISMCKNKHIRFTALAHQVYQKEINMASHGGMREGPGRPSGAVNKATPELKLNLSELVRKHTNDALDTLVEVMKSGRSDSARIAAATAILDRGYGKLSITQVDNSTGHVITAFEVVADYQESDFAE